MRSMILIFIVLITVLAHGGEIPAISPEFGMDEPVSSTAADLQRDSAIAFDGTNYLVVWEDKREDIYGENSFHIYGARVNKEGEVIDKAGIKLSDYAESSDPAVAFDGENYLVVWSSWNSSISGRRISKEGKVLDELEIGVSQGWYDNNNKTEPAVVFDGTNYFVVWNEWTMICGAKVSKGGKPLGGSFIAVRQSDQILKFDSLDFYAPAVAFDGENYMVVWTEFDYTFGSAILGARVAKNPSGFGGPLIDRNAIVIGGGKTKEERASFPDIVFDGSRYFVVWEKNRNGYDDVYGTWISSSGEVLDTDGMAISTAPDQQQNPKVAFDGTNYFVVWRDNRNISSYDIYGARVNKKGIVLDTDGIAVSVNSDNQEYPAVAFDGKNYLIAWDSWNDIFGMRMSTNGKFFGSNGSGDTIFKLPEIPISVAMSGQTMPDISFDGINYFAVWIDSRGRSNSVYGSRISIDGKLLDPEGVFIGENAYYGKKPSVAFDGTNYLVVWAGYPDRSVGILKKYELTLKGARVSKEGKLLDKTAFKIAPLTVGFDDQSPEVVFNGSSFMVVWVTNVCGCAVYPHGNYVCYCDPFIKGANVFKDGKVKLNSEFEIADAYVSGIACGKLNCLIAWRKGSGITAALFSEDFTRISSSEINIAGSIKLFPSSVIYDGTDYIIVWSDTSWENDYDLGISRITEEGEVADNALTISSTTNNIPDYREIVFDGENYLAVWGGDLERGEYSLDIYASFMSAEGKILSEEDVIISSDEQLELAPAVASSGGGRSLIVYQHFDNRKNFNTYRIAARLVDPDINAFSDWDEAESDEDNENSVIDEDAEIISDHDVSVTDSEDEEIRIDEDADIDNDAVISEKKSSGCSCIMF